MQISQVYVILTLILWTTWALISNYLAVRLNSWTIIFCGGFASLFFMISMFAFRPTSSLQWPGWFYLFLILTSTITSIAGGYTYLLALSKLSPVYVTPVSHLYLILAPLIYLIAAGLRPSFMEFLGFVFVSAGIICFLIGHEPSSTTSIVPKESVQSLK